MRGDSSSSRVGCPPSKLGCPECQKKGLAMNEFQRTLMNILEKRGMSVADLAERAGYNPLFFENIITGKSRQIPVDFFLRIAQALDLSDEEKDALVRSWAFGRA
jgi:predicted transcriptional regulator